jgi:membrane-associated protease RseP (regulator of RpoE activity)
VVENNIMVNNSFHSHVWFDNSGDVFAHNIVFGRYQPINMPRQWGKEVDYNFLQDANASHTVPAESLQKASHQDAHSLTGDAMFVDPVHGDFTVREGSPVLALGFKNFPMNQFGVTAPSLRAIARTPSFATGVEPASTRDPGVRDWQGAKVRNILGLGEQSAHGLSGETGILVLDVPNDSPAARAGLRVNDVILGVDGITVDTVSDLVHATAGTAAGKSIELTVSRDQQTIKLKV